ncbi:hypothetical protein FJ959_09920 [Mesorhizobium sp. B2-2-4]|uniref:hypothetical protein n=1 Tax=unclassified Mesorhizobium TaxID=325217 RepID=UPI001129995B|nr:MULTISPECIES: hypothetical protein [unclassified Mesorhizobium]TPM59175.1 hypothetical protein FJ959_09920 [Mesorhizobium sp. B2-2-4]TPM67660.1 hypothetical protein FJ965_11060 [Mesorhizobium sp. B2-2-1]TPN66941.1 hypothetical protein FJ984_15920 [Mesorhizobium sp. B1-1-3]
MTDTGDGQEDDPGIQFLARRLAREVDISVAEARGLIKLIGTDWNSLVREAKIWKELKGSAR